MKLKMIALVGFSLLVGAGLIACNGRGPTQFPTLDSPVTVAGGSIMGTVGTKGAWNRIQFESIYFATSSNNDFLVLNGLQGVPASPFRNTGGWLIEISTYDENATSKPKTISFCSSVSADTVPHCDGSSLRSDRRVYLQANGYNRLEERGSFHELRFHDTGSHCDNHTNNESGCDMISSIKITTVNNPSGVNGTYKCEDEKKCSITVGN